MVIVGHQASEAVAVYAQYCLGKIRKNVTRFVTDVSATPGLANQLSDKDVALVFEICIYGSSPFLGCYGYVVHCRVLNAFVGKELSGNVD